jgi:hypothetical protein
VGCVNSLYGSQDAESYDQSTKRHCVTHLGDGLQHVEVLLKEKKNGYVDKPVGFWTTIST